MTRTTSVAIVGAGLGGLTAAIALLKRGFDVTVFEQASTLGEVGAGIQVSPNAMKVLIALGLDEQALRTAFEPEAHVVRSWQSGRVVARTQMKGVYKNQFGAGYYGFHRADLHAVLVQALPPERIRLNAKCTAVHNTPDGATLSFEDGTQVRSDIVVGADGIHSVVREQVFGPMTPRFTGVVCWRGLVPTASLPAGLIPPDMTVWFGPRSSIVHYYVRNGTMINWAAFHEQDWRQESWKIEGDRNEVLETYKDWNPMINELVSRTEKLYKWAVFDREPLPQWTRGRVTLLGDAAHPMLPSIAQGACMAIEDAYTLATALEQSPAHVEVALQAYEAARRPRTTRVQLTSRERSRQHQLDSPLARLRRDIKIAFQKLLNPKQHTYKIEWIYSHDVTRALGS